MWLGDLFGDDNFLAYTFEMLNCICGVNHAKWGIKWVNLILIDVVKWWILMMIFKVWICLMCYDRSMITWLMLNSG